MLVLFECPSCSACSIPRTPSQLARGSRLPLWWNPSVSTYSGTSIGSGGGGQLPRTSRDAGYRFISTSHLRIRPRRSFVLAQRFLTKSSWPDWILRTSSSYLRRSLMIDLGGRVSRRSSSDKSLSGEVVRFKIEEGTFFPARGLTGEGNFGSG